MIKQLLIILSITLCCLCYKSCEPFGVRIFYGQEIKDSSSSEKIVVYFNTVDLCERSYALIITKSGFQRIQCSITSLKLSAETNNYQTYIHKCRTDRIEYEQIFHYNVFGWDGSSANPIYSGNYTQIKLMNPFEGKTAKFIVLADWSKIESNIYKYTPIDDMFLKIKTAQNINGLIILGDIGYDLDSNNCQYYQKFLVMLSKLAADIPVLMITGNHQYNTKDNWQLYTQSFETYGLTSELAVGLNLGPLYLVPFDPYSLLYAKKASETDQTSQKLTKVLIQAKKAQRFVVPASHYPLACSGTSKNCNNDRTLMKSYWDSMLENSVSLYLGAHYHSYQRLYPYTKGDKFTTQAEDYNSNEGYLISIVEGVAGNDKEIIESIDSIQAFTASYTVGETGFGILQFSQTNVSYRHLSTIQGQSDKIQIFLQKNQKKKKFNSKMLREQ